MISKLMKKQSIWNKVKGTAMVKVDGISLTLRRN
jgi:hypothetical protein